MAASDPPANMMSASPDETKGTKKGKKKEKGKDGVSVSLLILCGSHLRCVHVCMCACVCVCVCVFVCVCVMAASDPPANMMSASPDETTETKKEKETGKREKTESVCLF